MRFSIHRLVPAIAALCVSGGAAVDQNPASAGTTTNRNSVGANIEAAYHNPALLGVDRPPSGGLLVFPFTNYGLGFWSDKLAIRPSEFIDFAAASTPEELSEITSRVLARSFRITDDDLEDTTGRAVSGKLTKGFEGGFRLYAGARASLLSAANRRWAVDVTTHADEELRIPEGPLFLVFSNDKGLLRGNTLDFSAFRQDLLWTTDLTLSLGLPVTIPALHDLFKLRYGAGGVAVKYVMGHSLLRAQMNPGSIVYRSAANELAVDGELLIQTAGSGMHGNFRFDNPFRDGLPVSGHGIGVDIGGILYDEHGTMTINVQNLGVLFWLHNTRATTLKIKKDDLDFYDIVKGVNEYEENASLTIFNRNRNEYLSDERDTLKESEGLVTPLPLSINCGYVLHWDLTKKWNDERLQLLGDYATAGANYEQQLSRGPGRSFVPRLSVGSEVGTLRGHLPLRAGLVLGGPEIVASALGLGAIYHGVSFNFGYKAIGNIFFLPRRGMELSAGLGWNWGFTIDPDKDGVVGQTDQCPRNAEDHDGFQDADGCPDRDNDNDGIPDSLDKCPNEAEDADCFQDTDGCPDPDNDNDGVPDSLDECPNVPEDLDGARDDDGCPEYDNDNDGIADSVDRCMNEPEDFDRFEDHDGCPDRDNDKDGIPDSLDRCPQEREMFNGFMDEDGCPDTLVKPTPTEEKVLRKDLSRINFKTASAELTTDSYTHLLNVVRFLQRYTYLRYEIQGHTDSRGDDDYNLLLSAARAASVRDFLTKEGIADSQMIAIGYGKTKPIAPNETAQGRAQNRRVQFEVIETVGDYERLRLLQADFRERVRGAQIKGASY